MNDDRIENDPSLIAPADGLISNPIIIVHKKEDGAVQYLLMLGELDEHVSDHRVAGVLLSDLLDHMAAVYAGTTGRDQRDLRDAIAKVMRDEDRFKEKDPSRGRARGATIWPKRN